MTAPSDPEYLHAITLTLTWDNPCNTTIHDASGAILYVVKTDFTNIKKPVTRVHRGGGDLVAEWVWRDGLRSDLLTFAGRPSAPASDWLKKSVVPFASTATFKDSKGRVLKWGNNAPGLLLQLFAPDSKTEPVVRFNRQYLDRNQDSVDPPTVPAKLLIKASMQDVQDEILVSFLLLEKRRREKENENVSRAAGIASAAGFGTPVTIGSGGPASGGYGTLAG